MPSQAHPFSWRTIHVAAYPSGEVRSPLSFSLDRTFCSSSFQLQNNSSDSERADSRRHTSAENSDSERNPDCFRVRAKYLDGPARGWHGPAYYDLPGTDFKSTFFS